MRVLVVDDEPDYRYLVGVGLGLLGHEVSEAPDGEQACALATVIEPDVILVDYILLGETGLSLLPRLRNASPDSAVVLHTVEREHAATFVGHPAGPDGLVDKGLGPNELASALDGIVTYHRSRNGRQDPARPRPPVN